VLDIDEIQGEEPEVIIRDKAQKAFDELGQPVIVTDDSWAIAALGGFPGPYMKSINHWFSADDFMRLMKGKKDRGITLIQMLAYCDGLETVVFRSDIPGTIPEHPAGNYGPPIMKVVALDGDNGKTISEVYDDGKANELDRLHKRSDAWQTFATWYKQKVAP